VYGVGPEDFARFRLLGWPEYLQSQRHYAAIKVYQAVCLIEQGREFRAGSELRVSHQQIADVAAVDRKTVGRCLPLLAEDQHGLIEYEPGSGFRPECEGSRCFESEAKARYPVASSRLLCGSNKYRGHHAPYIGGITPPIPTPVKARQSWWGERRLNPESLKAYTRLERDRRRRIEQASGMPYPRRLFPNAPQRTRPPEKTPEDVPTSPAQAKQPPRGESTERFSRRRELSIRLTRPAHPG
jgi:hypothetical protein